MREPPRRLQAGVIVRTARPGELARIGDLRVSAYQADGFLAEASAYAQELRGLGADGSGEVLVAEEGGVIVGTVMLQPWPDASEVARGREEAEIRALAVSPAARGRGIGRALLAAVTERAAARGIRHLVLLTRPDMRAAQHLYAEAGFSRLPDRDWSPGPGLTLLAYGRVLAPASGDR
jgi:ribosomal protein S18 acetylase RimI-like enzyme